MNLALIDKHTTLIKLKDAGLDCFPKELLDFADLELLDLSGNRLSSLPDSFAGKLPKLKVLFLSDCRFTIFPNLAACPVLEMVAFKGNGMQQIPENVLPRRLRWLILTNNAITALPQDMGTYTQLEKCMLAGNRLTSLPESMTRLDRLALLRLSANQLQELPAWLFQLPSLCWLAFAGNPGAPHATCTLESMLWTDIDLQHVLGEGASGLISQARLKINGKQVAVKVFKGEVTSDGLPADELNACIAAGAHPHLIDPLASITGHPENKRGLVLELVPPTYTNLGLPPNLKTCSRDNFDRKLSQAMALRILRGIAAAATHLHARGIAHGDLYAHNILIDTEGHALFGDFGAATLYGDKPMEQVEVKAFGWLVDDIMTISGIRLAELRDACIQPETKKRPIFSQIEERLGAHTLEQ